MALRAYAFAAALMAESLSGAHAATLTIGWGALRPADQSPSRPGLLKGSTIPDAVGRTLADRLLGETIELAGYLLPVDRDGDLVYEFMLVPEAGMCSHMPAPPPNQIVHVSLAEPFRISRIYEPVVVTGSLRGELETTQFYMIDGPKVVETGYSIGGARVEAGQ